MQTTTKCVIPTLDCDEVRDEFRNLRLLLHERELLRLIAHAINNHLCWVALISVFYFAALGAVALFLRSRILGTLSGQG